MKSQFLTAKQLSAMLGISEGTIRYWRNAGLGPAWHKLEGSIRYALKDVEVYVERSRRVPSVRAYMKDRHGTLQTRRSWHYDSAVNGKRFRGSTKEKTQSKARSIESALMQEAMDRRLPGRRRAVLLADFSVRFLEWVSASRLEIKSKMYYQRGWNFWLK